MTARRRERGLSLPELMVAMSIGLVILGAVVQALVLTSHQYRRAETLAQMQEHAAIALRFVREDLQMAGHWGLVSRATQIDGRATPAAVNPRALKLPTQCAPVLTTRLAFAIELARDTSGWGCANSNVALADGLVVRFAAAGIATPQRGRLQVDGNPLSARLIDDGNVSSTTGMPGALHDLQVMGYYVAPSSTVFPEQPVLRRVTLTATTRGPRFIDEEITAGVEALQVSVDVDSNGDGIADRTLQAGDADLALVDGHGAPLLTPMAVHVALIMRSESPRWRAVPGKRFRLADLDWQAPSDGHLRIAASQSVRLRNAVTP